MSERRLKRYGRYVVSYPAMRSIFGEQNDIKLLREEYQAWPQDRRWAHTISRIISRTPYRVPPESEPPLTREGDIEAEIEARDAELADNIDLADSGPTDVEVEFGFSGESLDDA